MWPQRCELSPGQSGVEARRNGNGSRTPCSGLRAAEQVCLKRGKASLRRYKSDGLLQGGQGIVGIGGTPSPDVVFEILHQHGSRLLQMLFQQGDRTGGVAVLAGLQVCRMLPIGLLAVFWTLKIEPQIPLAPLAVRFDESQQARPPCRRIERHVKRAIALDSLLPADANGA